MNHKFILHARTDVETLGEDQVHELVLKTLAVGQADATDTAGDDDLDDDARAEAALVRDFDFSLEVLPPVSSTNLLVAQASGFDIGLDELGFGADDDINGGDTVDLIGQHIVLLRRLPALAALVEAADKFLAGPDDFGTNYEHRAAAFDKVKGT